MDKMIGGVVKKVTKEGEKKAPIKSIKLKVKFQKASKDKALKDCIKDEK